MELCSNIHINTGGLDVIPNLFNRSLMEAVVLYVLYNSFIYRAQNMYLSNTEEIWTNIIII